MSLRPYARSLTRGVLAGMLALFISPIDVTPHTLRLGFGSTSYADPCEDYPARPPYIGGALWYEQDAHTVEASITTDPSPNICNQYNGASYWVMVLGPTTYCQQPDQENIRYMAFTQIGWLVGNAAGTIESPNIFTETQGVNEFCDEGPEFYGAITDTNTYFASLNTDDYGQSYGYLNVTAGSGSQSPLLPHEDPIDWNNTTSQGYQVSPETHDLGTYWSGTHVDFSGILYSSDLYVHPQPPTKQYVVGPMSTGNQYETFKIGFSGVNSYRVCDKRVANSGC